MCIRDRDIKKVVEPVLQKDKGSIYYINISQDNFKLGGSSFGQVLNSVGNEAPTVKNASYVATVFNTIQGLIMEDQIAAGHDVASGGLITTLLEMCFADTNLGATLNLSDLEEKDTVKVLFSENCGIVIQASHDHTLENTLLDNNIDFVKIGTVSNKEELTLTNYNDQVCFDICLLYTSDAADE